MTLPFFSVVVPTRDRSPQLTQCLRALQALEYPRERLELIVVNDGGAVPALENPAGIPLTLVTMPPGGPAAARNAAATRARGDYLAFTADDCLVEPQWLARFSDAALRSPQAALAGPIRNGLPDDRYASASHALAEYLSTTLAQSGSGARFVTPNNLAVPAAGFRAVGGFDPAFHFGAGEDRDFCARWLERGHELIEVPDAIVEHRHPLSLQSFVRQHFNYGRGSCLYRQRLLARRGRRGGREPLTFYANLLRYPPRGWPRTLMALSQLANAIGYARQSWRAAPADQGRARQASN